MDSYGLCKGSLSGSCENCHELSGSIKRVEFLCLTVDLLCLVWPCSVVGLKADTVVLSYSVERHDPAAWRRCKVKTGRCIFNFEIMRFGIRPSCLIPRKRLPDTQSCLGTGREKRLCFCLESNSIFPICSLYSLVAFHVPGVTSYEGGTSRCIAQLSPFAQNCSSCKSVAANTGISVNWRPLSNKQHHLPWKCCMQQGGGRHLNHWRNKHSS